MLVDSHCHLNMPQLKDNLEIILANCLKYNIGLLNNICTNLSEFEEIWQLTKDHNNIYCSVGVHPDSAHIDNVTIEKLSEFASRNKVIGLGETGLDYYHDITYKKQQIKNFEIHIEVAKLTKLPLIIHTRNAEEDTINILTKKKSESDFSAVIHCFTGSKNLAAKMLDIGAYISFSGIITFKNVQELQEIISYIPMDRLLIETDSPFLAPAPYRGKINEPSFLYHIAKKISELKLISFEELSDQTTENFFRLFEKAKQTT